MASEFPKTFYRYSADGEREGKTFATEADVEKGWLTWEEFAKLPVPAKKPAPKVDGQGAVEAGKRLVAAEQEAARLTDTVKLLTDEAALKDQRIAALETQAEAQRAFLQQIAGDENCPEALKAAISGLLGEEAAETEAEAEAPAKKRSGKK